MEKAIKIRSTMLSDDVEMLRRSKHQRIVAAPRLINGKPRGYTYSVESRDEACNRISERSSKQAFAQNKSINCFLTEECKRIGRHEQWRIGKLQKTIDLTRESLSNHISYRIVLCSMQNKEQCDSKIFKPASEDESIASISESNGYFGCYGDKFYDKLLSEIETVKSVTFNGWKKRELLSKKLLLLRKPMPCLDRTLSDKEFFAMAEKMVDDDREIKNEFRKVSSLFGGSQTRAASMATNPRLFSMETKSKTNNNVKLLVI